MCCVGGEDSSGSNGGKPLLSWGWGFVSGKASGVGVTLAVAQLLGVPSRGTAGRRSLLQPEAGLHTGASGSACTSGGV